MRRIDGVEAGGSGRSREARSNGRRGAVLVCLAL